MTNIQDYDDINPLPYQNQIHDKLHHDFEWKYFESIAYPKSYKVENDGSGFVGVIVPNPGQTNFFNLLLPLVGIASYKYTGNEYLKTIFRVRAVMLLKDQYKGMGSSHIDMNEPHTTMIYYVNDSDGPTCFFDEDKKIIKQVHPKKGRLVAFPGETFHAGYCPTKSNYRYLININIETIQPTSIPF